MGMTQIVYASRTHSQLAQAMKELKRTNYKHVKSAVLGSRDQMCLHPDLAAETGPMKVRQGKPFNHISYQFDPDYVMDSKQIGNPIDHNLLSIWQKQIFHCFRKMYTAGSQIKNLKVRN